MLGRGTRKYPVKDDCLIIDLVGNTESHDLVTVASLFDVEPEALHQRTVSEATEEKITQTWPMPYVAKTLELRAHEVKTLFSRKRLAWVPVTEGVFALSVGQGQCLLLRHTAHDRYDVAKIAMYHPWTPAEVLTQGLTLDYAQGYAEEVVRRSQAGALANPHARFWYVPATEKTIGLAHRLGLRLPAEATQEQASQAITRHQVQAWLRAQRPVHAGA
jgi:superfamily II DNA or RNA helicase